MDFVDPAQRDKWTGIIGEAESNAPSTFNPNGYVVAAFQAAWSSIAHTAPGSDHYKEGVVQAVRIGNDTDTVAAIAGGLLGAAYGVDAIPGEWLDQAHGWPGFKTVELRSLARAAAGIDNAV
jgi:ADP-ribosylglycohydrolase